MNTFVNSVSNQEVRTTNGMKAVNSTSNDVVDLFFKIGASRGKDIVPQFSKAYFTNPELATRVALWARDVRGGAGERKLFTDIVSYLTGTDPELATRVIKKVPELGRWKDLVDINYKDRLVKNYAFRMIGDALRNQDGLCAKWMPRKGEFAVELRNYLGWTPKFYRKTLVGLTKVVETQMCDKNWNEIEFSHVPSLASARYRKAFNRNATEAYAQFVAKLEKGETTVNTGAVYPHDVTRNLPSHSYGYSDRLDVTELKFINEQWDALPNYVGDNKILPMIDVSGSMTCGVGGNRGGLTCMQVAVSLGLYCSEKNQGAFNGVHLTFSGKPRLMKTNGSITDRYIQTLSDDWGMNTDLERALALVLKTAVHNNVRAEDMPETILIFSDMQFDHCASMDVSAYEMIRDKFAIAGYTAPKIVFWNLNAYDNVPVKFNDQGVALVSGFSPAILESILSGADFTPVAIMNRAIMDERYNF